MGIFLRVIKMWWWVALAIVCAGLVGGTMLAVGCNTYGSFAVTAFIFLYIVIMERG